MTMHLDRRQAKELTYGAFCETYMKQGRPVMIENIITRGWSAPRLWFNRSKEEEEDLDVELNVAFFASNCGHVNVQVVQQMDDDDDRHVQYGEEQRRTMTMNEFLIKWKEGTGYYLKDWHVHQSMPNVDQMYQYDDWLNWWWDQKNKLREDESTDEMKWDDDYKFVYIGQKGTFTPLHHDVLSSYSWSVNLSGQKKWILFPPSQTWKLRSVEGKQYLSDIRDDAKIDRHKFPHYHDVEKIEIIQHVGEALFVPSQWYHQVINLEDTISINHNWFNSTNLPQVLDFLISESKAVQHEIQSCRASLEADGEWESHCEFLLSLNAGMSLGELENLLQARLAHVLGHKTLNEGHREEQREILEQSIAQLHLDRMSVKC